MCKLNGMESDFNCWPTSSIFIWEPSLPEKKKIIYIIISKTRYSPSLLPVRLHFHSRTTLRDRPQENKQIITIWLSQAKKSHWKSHYDGISFSQFLQTFRFEGKQTAAGHALQKLVAGTGGGNPISTVPFSRVEKGICTNGRIVARMMVLCCLSIGAPGERTFENKIYFFIAFSHNGKQISTKWPQSQFANNRNQFDSHFYVLLSSAADAFVLHSFFLF